MPGGLTLLASANADIPTPAAGKATIFFSLTSGVPSYKNDAGSVLPLGTTGAAGPIGPVIPFALDDSLPDFMLIPGPPGSSGSAGRLIGQQIITATGAGTYTPTPGTGAIVMYLVGGGGGGAGSATNAGGGSFSTFGRSGAAGAVLIKRLTAGFSGAGYVVGAKGGGGAAGNNNGTVGASTTFTETVGPTTFTAAGGTEGTTIANFQAPNLSNGGNGAIATNGDININSTRAGVSLCLNSACTMGGNGGNGMFGGGGSGGSSLSANTATAGGNASGKGAGGGGSSCNGVVGAPVAGGDGSDGMILIYEYSA